MSNDKLAATFGRTRNPHAVCGDQWRDRACAFGVGVVEHVCVRAPGHPMPHECQCGSRVIE